MIVYDSVFIFCLVFEQEYLQDPDKIARFFVSVRMVYLTLSKYTFSSFVDVGINVICMCVFVRI